MSGVLTKKFGRKYSLLAGVGELAHVLGQLVARVLPGEVGVGLAEAELGEVRITAARVNASARKTTSRSRAWTSSISHSQNANGLVCGLSTRKTRTPRSTQYSTTSQQRVPQPAPVLAVEVDVVDVLVALGRVLGVLERAVRAVVEPLRVLAQPGMVGRALDREVERDVDPVLRRPRRSALEVLERAELRVDRVVAAARRRRSPRVSPGRRARRCSALLRPLRLVQADRVDRRQVEDVEAELGEPRELRLDAREAHPRSAGTAHTRRRSARAPGRPRSRAAAPA